MHLSKVRSLTLDSWETEQLKVTIAARPQKLSERREIMLRLL